MWLSVYPEKGRTPRGDEPAGKAPKQILSILMTGKDDEKGVVLRPLEFRPRLINTASLLLFIVDVHPQTSLTRQADLISWLSLKVPWSLWPLLVAEI